MKQEKKIPSILALLLLLGGIFVAVNLSRSSRLFRSKASSSCQPINPQVTNITHTSVDISFTTAANCSSSLLINDRTIENPLSSSFIHYFSVHGLEANQSYPFSFIVNGTSWQQSEYQTQTASTPLSSIPVSSLAWGKVLNTDQSPAQGALLYLNIPGASPLSSLVTSSGNWNVSLAISFNSSKDNWFTPPSGTEEDIVVISSDGQATQITGNTSTNDPVPDIIIGQNSFTALTPTSPASSAQNFPSVTTTASSLKKLKINNPQDNESIFVQKPEFFGDAPANSQVVITVNSPQPINGQATTNTQGNWSWSPPQDLSLGDHTISVKTKDPQTGLWQTITHNFTVYANEDNSLSFSSSPSATIIPSTPTPTTVSSPTSIPTSQPTTQPTVQPTTRTVKPATEAGVPAPGFSLPTFLIFLFAGIFIFSSYFLLS